MKQTLLLIVLLLGSVLSSSAQKQFLANAGVYSSSTSYNQSDIVSVSGTYYISLISNNLNNTPASSPSDWASLGGGSGTVSDGAGTTTPGLMAQSTGTAHVIAYVQNPLQTCDASTVPNYASAVCTVTISSAQILAFDGSGATAVPMILAPGAGRAINPGASTFAEYIFNTTPYVLTPGANAITIVYAGSPSNVIGQTSEVIDASQAFSNMGTATLYSAPTPLATADISNKAMYVYLTATYTTGDGTIKFTLPYTVVPVS